MSPVIQLPHGDIDEPLLEFGKRHANMLLGLIRESSLEPSDFSKITKSATNDVVAITYDNALTHGDISPLYFRLQLEPGTPNNWTVETDFPDFTHRNVHPNTGRITSSVELYGIFANWLTSIERYWRFRKAEEGPDMWEELFQAPLADAATIWTPDYKFKEAEVNDFNHRMEKAFQDIAELKLLSAETLAELKKESDARAPKVGKDWGSFREMWVGWIFGKVADGLIDGSIMQIILKYSAGYLAAKMGIAPHFPLLP